MVKFKSHALHIIRIQYCNAGWGDNPPSLISSLILHHEQATHAKHFDVKFIWFILHFVVTAYLISLWDLVLLSCENLPKSVAVQ